MTLSVEQRRIHRLLQEFTRKTVELIDDANEVASVLSHLLQQANVLKAQLFDIQLDIQVQALKLDAPEL